MSARRRSPAKWRGCLETAGLVFFALLLLGFAASTWVQHRSGRDEESAAEAAPTGEAPSLDRSRIRIDVRNGSGVEGAAGRVTEFLRERGFDVVDFGNADRFDYPRTTVVDRGGDPRLAREVAGVLTGVPVEPAAETDPSVDVGVIIGRDVDAVLARPAEVPRRGWRAWLDRLRGR